jgi:uncharacterized Fe-S cluster protein YjdI
MSPYVRTQPSGMALMRSRIRSVRDGSTGGAISRGTFSGPTVGVYGGAVTPTSESETRDAVRKEYATDEIVVEWEPALCFHSQNCIRALPLVFDPQRRPWVNVDAGTADEIEAAVRLCPSGALRAHRPGAARAAAARETEVRASDKGPLLLSGGVRVVDGDGKLLYEGERAALCRCGGSANKPFCDGTHRTNGFSG